MFTGKEHIRETYAFETEPSSTITLLPYSITFLAEPANLEGWE